MQNSPQLEVAGLNSYKLSVKEWVEKTNAIGLMARAGEMAVPTLTRTQAFEFGMWISPEFKIYLIKEFERLKEQEQQLLGWDIKRNLAKINYLYPYGRDQRKPDSAGAVGTGKCRWYMPAKPMC